MSGDHSAYDDRREEALRKAPEMRFQETMTQTRNLPFSTRRADDRGVCSLAYEGCEGALDPQIFKSYCEKGGDPNCGYR